MNRFLFAGKGAPATIGGGGMPKNHGWQTVTEPGTIPVQDFQVNGELGNDAPQVMATALTNPTIAGAASNRVTGVSPSTYGCTSPSGLRIRARNAIPRSIRPRAQSISPLSRPEKGQACSGPGFPDFGSFSKVLGAVMARPLGLLMRSDPTQGPAMRDGATRLHDTGGRAGIGYGRTVLRVAAIVAGNSSRRNLSAPP